MLPPLSDLAAREIREGDPGHDTEFGGLNRARMAGVAEIRIVSPDRATLAGVHTWCSGRSRSKSVCWMVSRTWSVTLKTSIGSSASAAS